MWHRELWSIAEEGWNKIIYKPRVLTIDYSYNPMITTVLSNLHCVSKKLTLFIFLWLLAQLLTDVNNIW